MKRIISCILVMAFLLSFLPAAPVLIAEAAPVKIVGDLDRDGEITDWDGVMLTRHLAGWNTTAADEAIFDIDGDGEITDWDGVMFDRYLAGWSVTTQVGKWLALDITYADTKGASNPNPTSYEPGANPIALEPLKAVENYTFAGWYIGNSRITHIPTDRESALTITAHWTPINYKISYLDTKGAVNSNPSTYNIESADIVLKDLHCDGYTFAGWYRGNTRVTTIPAGSYGNISLTAKWTTCTYTIRYENTKDAANGNPVGYTVENGVPVLEELQKEGYTFDGWYLDGKKVTSVPKGTTGNITLKAKWTPIIYTATFFHGTTVVATRYFTVEDTVLENIPEVPYKAGYTGKWYSYVLGAKNLTIYPYYTANQYTITYSNTKGATNRNPSTYTVETDTIQLSNLSYTGYNFMGWYQGSEKVTSISKGTTGNITLMAVWSTTNYVITYTNTKGAENPNPTEYTVEDGRITFTNLEKEGYTFKGWYLDGKNVTSFNTNIYNPRNIELEARWTPKTYNLSYYDTKDAYNPNPATYTIESYIVLEELSVEGYRFLGWYTRLADFPFSEYRVYSIELGSTGNRSLTAKWSPINYSITYQNTKGSSDNYNPHTYNIESSTITLSPISTEGYIFEGWYIGDKKVAEIPTGSTGDVVLTAKWAPVEYSIHYETNLDVEITNPNPTVYTPEGSIQLTNVSADYFNFCGWYADAAFTIPMTTIEKGTVGELTLYAKWEFTGTYISTAEEFANIVYDMSGSYMLTADITISAALGDETNPFTGYFNGNGHRIDGSEVFSVNKGTISQVNSGNLLCGTNEGTIRNCISEGGIARINHGTIARCKSTGYVSYCEVSFPFQNERKEWDSDKDKYVHAGYIKGYGNMYYYLGGLVAYNTGTITECACVHDAFQYTITEESYVEDGYDGYVKYLGAYAGGLAGYSSGEISYSYYSATSIEIECSNRSNFNNYDPGIVWDVSIYNASASLDCGGLAGYGANIYACYVSADVIAGRVYNSDGYPSADIGSLSGWAKSIKDSFANVGEISHIETSTSLGRVYHLADIAKSQCVNSYYNSDCVLSCKYTQTVGIASGAVNFKARNFIINTLGWSEDIWNLQNGSLPKLAWEQ